MIIDADFGVWGNMLTLVGSVVGAVWTLAIWLSRRFNAIEQLVYSEVKSLRDLFTQKLDYHEKHDDNRFSEINGNIWELRVSNATRDALIGQTIGQNENIRTEALVRKTPKTLPSGV